MIDSYLHQDNTHSKHANSAPTSSNRAPCINHTILTWWTKKKPQLPTAKPKNLKDHPDPTFNLKAPTKTTFRTDHISWAIEFIFNFYTGPSAKWPGKIIRH